MNSYLKDVFAQPAILRKAFEEYISSESLNKMNQLARKKYHKVIYSGMGGSHYACYGACIELVRNGYNAFVKSAGELLHYEYQLLDENTLLFLVSQSGESAEIVHLIDKIPDSCTVVAITNKPDSTLAKRGNFVFTLNVPDEEAVATRTYLSTIILLGIIAKTMTKGLNDEMIDQFRSAINHIEKFLSKDFEAMKQELKEFIGVPGYICLTGRGFSYSTVLAGGLFIREVGKFPCISIDSGEFRHGPFELIDKDFTGIIVSPEGLTYGINRKLAEDIAKRGGKVLFITNRKTEFKHENIFTVEMENMDEFLAPITEIVPIQIVANNIAENKNIEVGKFRWSSKVVQSE
ncbi:MAG: SIS domain-containing protein [Clostridia bacterium]|nr:SIS domain-containing protein [Clostridia bacterium]